ncbi:MAG: hypothetical protein ACPLTR_04265 [Thermacetogeniaceae bacterium]
MQQERERLVELIRTLPDDKIAAISAFIDRILSEGSLPEGEEGEELLMG